MLFMIIYNILKNSPREEIFREGFKLSEQSFREIPDNYIWRDKESFVIESSQPESTLVQLGRKIYDCACNDPELTY